MSYPLIPILLAFISGIFTASYELIGEEIAFSLSIVFLLLTILWILRGWRFNPSTPLTRTITFSMTIILSFFFLGALLGSQETNPRFPQNHIINLPELFRNKVRVEGILYRPPERFVDKTRLYILGERVFLEDRIRPATGNLLLTIEDTDVVLKYGDRVRFLTRLRIPRNLGNPGGFDYEGHLAREDISATGYVENGRWVVRMAGGAGNPLRSTLEGMRDRIRTFIDGIDSVETREVLKALILGEQKGIPREIRDAFMKTGTAHILAISGLHISIIAFGAYWVIYKLLALSEGMMLAYNIRKVAALFSIPPILLYGLIAGLPVSTQRAIIMVTVFILAVLLDRERELYNTLATAALIILVISPSAIYDISFQLSFTSILSIVYLYPRLKHLLKGPPIPLLPTSLWDKVKYRVLDLALVSISASIGTAPVVAYHFHRVSIIGVLANLIAVPVMGFAVVVLGLMSCMSLFVYQALAGVILTIASISLKVSICIIDLFARLPYSSIWVTTPTVIEIVLFYGLVASMVGFKASRVARYALLVTSIGLLIDYGYWYYHLNYNSNLRVTYISVGQGDSTLVEFPMGKRMLIDGGGFHNEDFDTGEKVIAPLLWKDKIKSIDYLVLSHPQADHLNGLVFIANHFTTKEFWWNGDSGGGRYEELMSALDTRGIKKVAVNRATNPMEINGVRVEFLHPPDGHYLHGVNPVRKSSTFQQEGSPSLTWQATGLSNGVNERSLVVKLTYRGASLLFTGDIGMDGEAILLQGKRDLKAEILKVPHHGSNTSSTSDFIDRVRPGVAVISLGHNNPFGFPHPEVVDRYKRVGARIYRTDSDGAVTIETDGEGIRVKTFR